MLESRKFSPVTTDRTLYRFDVFAYQSRLTPFYAKAYQSAERPHRWLSNVQRLASVASRLAKLTDKCVQKACAPCSPEIEPRPPDAGELSSDEYLAAFVRKALLRRPSALIAS